MSNSVLVLCAALVISGYLNENMDAMLMCCAIILVAATVYGAVA